MTERVTWSSPWSGAAIGAALTAPLLATLFLAHQLVRLPFVPFDVFDWIARTAPGSVVTFGIDTIVGAIRTLGIGEISEAAKTVERTLAIGGLLATGAVSGAVLFVVLRRRPHAAGLASGAVLGAVLGAMLVPVSLVMQAPSAAAALAGGAWILAAFTAWGAALGWSYDTLAAPARVADRRQSVPASVERTDRRRFIIRLGGAAAGITVVGAGVGAGIAARRGRSRTSARGTPWSERNPLPNAGASVTPARGTRPEFTRVEDHYQIDINTSPPRVDAAEWRLALDGLVNRPADWTLEELRTRYEPLDQFVTLSCISNPIAGSLISTQRWTGVPVRRLLEEVEPQPEATHLRVRSVDGFHETLDIADAMMDERIMLAYAWDGLPLPPAHGFPLRLYVPDRYGMKQPKWIETIEAIDEWKAGYWVSRGWDREARMHATAVIDTVGVDMMIGDPGDGLRVPIGGIAHAGARGISRVEVRVDDGSWTVAQLRSPLSQKTWVIWRFEWPFIEGEHTFTVRCVDGSGKAQIAERSPVRPSGATGLHSEEVML